MCIFEEEMKVSINMHMDDDRRIVHNVMVQILQIFLTISKLPDSIDQLLLSLVV